MGPVVKPRGIGAGGPPLDRLVRAAAAEEARASPPHPPRKRGSRGCCFVRVWRRQGRSMDPRLHGDERPWRARLPPRLMVSGDEPCGGQWRTVLYHPPSSLDFARDEGSASLGMSCEGGRATALSAIHVRAKPDTGSKQGSPPSPFVSAQDEGFDGPGRLTAEAAPSDPHSRATSPASGGGKSLYISAPDGRYAGPRLPPCLPRWREDWRPAIP